MRRALLISALWLLALGGTTPAQAVTLQETPMLAADVAAGKLPPVASRVPSAPEIVPFDGKQRVVGKSGGAGCRSMAMHAWSATTPATPSSPTSWKASR